MPASKPRVVPPHVQQVVQELAARYLTQEIPKEELLAFGRIASSPDALFPASVKQIAGMSANVHAVGARQKVVSGMPTGEYVARVYVLTKSTEGHLIVPQSLPPAIDGIHVEVVQAPPAFRLPFMARASEYEPSFRFTPLVAGVSVGHNKSTAGTIGYFARSRRKGDSPDDILLLSNHHVLAETYNDGRAGDVIVHPGPSDGGALPNDQVAEFVRAVPIDTCPSQNSVDAAVAKVTVPHSAQIVRIGKVVGRSTAEEKMKVHKHGRTTGLTEGVVSDIFYTARLHVDPSDLTKVAIFANQIQVKRTAKADRYGQPFMSGGDSGALLVEFTPSEGPNEQATVRAVGLLFAAPLDGSYGVACPIDAVERELEIELL